MRWDFCSHVNYQQIWLFGLNKGSYTVLAVTIEGFWKICPLNGYLYEPTMISWVFPAFFDVEDIKMVKVQRLHREDQQKREEETLKRKQEKEAHFWNDNFPVIVLPSKKWGKWTGHKRSFYAGAAQWICVNKFVAVPAMLWIMLLRRSNPAKTTVCKTWKTLERYAYIYILSLLLLSLLLSSLLLLLSLLLRLRVR